MKTRTIIEELTQADLVDLLCTATYGSQWLEIYAPDREGVEIEEKDCREDVWAKCLLAGKTIECTDLYSEGEWNYGKLPHKIDDSGYVVYSVTLQDIKNGLQECADGNAGSWCLTCFNTFRENDGGLDNPQAEYLMQIILFGELIYG